MHDNLVPATPWIFSKHYMASWPPFSYSISSTQLFLSEVADFYGYTLSMYRNLREEFITQEKKELP